MRDITGMKVVIVPPARVDHQVKRTWKERPLLVTYKTVAELTEVLEDGAVVKYGTTLSMNATTYDKLSKQLEQERC